MNHNDKFTPPPQSVISGIVLLVNSDVFCMQWNDVMSFHHQTSGLLNYITYFLPNGLSLEHECFLQL